MADETTNETTTMTNETTNETTTKTTAPKRQKIVHLSPIQWVLLRPNVFFGSSDPSELSLPLLRDGTVEWCRVTLSPMIVALFNELVVNAVDNAYRAKQKYIHLGFSTETGKLTISNDGCGIPIAKDAATDAWSEACTEAWREAA